MTEKLAPVEPERSPLLGPGGCVDKRVASQPQKLQRPSWTAAAAAALRPYFADDEEAARTRAVIMDIHLQLLVDMRARLAHYRRLLDAGRFVHPEALRIQASLVATTAEDLEEDMRGYEWQAWLRQQPAPSRPEPAPRAAKAKGA